jgi:hypothetical protein
MTPATMRTYGELCGWTLARAHARSGTDRQRRINTGDRRHRFLSVHPTRRPRLWQRDDSVTETTSRRV